MQPELKSALVDIARKNGRSLNAEVVLRLEQSFQAPEPSAYPPGVSQPESTYAPRRAIPTQLQEMMLDIFDTLPVEKQLALISLFK